MVLSQYDETIIMVYVKNLEKWAIAGLLMAGILSAKG